MTIAKVDAQLAEKLEERLKTPRSEFIEMGSGDTLFGDIRFMLTQFDEKPSREKLD